MVRVKFNATGQRYAEEIVTGETTVREYLQGKNAMMGANFTINGAPINDKLDYTFDDIKNSGLAQDDRVTIFETIKTSNAAA